MRFRRSVPYSRCGFTLIEILIVIGIVALLTALLFPAFKGAQERARQASCLANLQQVYLAVRLYKDDEREYPMSLAVLMPDTALLQNTAGSADTAMGANIGGTGYFRKGNDVLLCPDDDTDLPEATSSGVPNLRSSYGDVSNAPTKIADYETSTNYDARNNAFYDEGQNPDWGRLAWNYWGYDDQGVAFRTADEAVSYLSGIDGAKAKALLKIPDKEPGSGYTVPYQNLLSQGVYFNPRGLAADAVGGAFLEEPREENPLRYSLANRFAPAGTIVTHCVYHRLLTGQDIYTPNPKILYSDLKAATGARDIVLRVDGTVKSYEISDWQTPAGGHAPLWQISDF